jgi:hypothetical protein
VVNGVELKSQFLLDFDDEVLRFLAQHIHDSYPDALERAASLDREFRRRAIPQIRHYIIQSRIRHLTRHYPHVAAETDYSEGLEPYTVLRSGKFYLTVSMAREPGQLPRHSDFRQGNATDNLFDRIKSDDVEDWYAILSHVPAWDNSSPVHLSVLFPEENYSGVYAYIDLTPLIDFDLESPPLSSEEIEAPEPTLRKRLPKQKEA